VRFRRVLASLVFFGAGCTLTNIDNLTGGVGPGIDAASDGSRLDDGDPGGGSDALSGQEDAPFDAPPDVKFDVTVDAGSDAPSIVNLHPNGTFESSSSPWIGYKGTIALDPTAHTGTGSLRACSGAGSGVFTADDKGPIPNPINGATYRVSAWVRDAPSAPAASGLTLFLRTIAGGIDQQQSMSSGAPLTSAWQRLETTLLVSKPADVLNVYVGGNISSGACFLLDDVVVDRIQ